MNNADIAPEKRIHFESDRVVALAGQCVPAPPQPMLMALLVSESDTPLPDIQLQQEVEEAITKNPRCLMN